MQGRAQKTEYDISQWLDFLAPTALVAAVMAQINSERRERIYNNKDPIDLGYSFPGLNENRQDLLVEVRKHKELLGRRPKIADIGAGFGSMSWKLMAAGAEVDAFELHKPAATEIKERIKAMSPLFWEGNQYDQLLTIYVGNAMKVLSKVEFENKYDFIWMGSLVHFLTPSDLKDLIQLLGRVLKPGGKILLEANTIKAFSYLANYALAEQVYNKAKTKGMEFPGFMTINSSTLFDNLTNRPVHATIISAFDQDEMKQHSISPIINGYGKGFADSSAFTLQQKKLYDITCKTISRNQSISFPKINDFYQVTHLIDEETAKKAFSTSGFSDVKIRTDSTGGQLFLQTQKPIPSLDLDIDQLLEEKEADKIIRQSLLSTGGVSSFFKGLRSLVEIPSLPQASDKMFKIFDINKPSLMNQNDQKKSSLPISESKEAKSPSFKPSSC